MKNNLFSAKDLEIIYKLAEKIHGCGGTVYFVGGYVRDKLLRIESKDIDVEIHNIPEDKLIEILSAFGEVRVIKFSFTLYRVKGCHVDFTLPREGNGSPDSLKIASMHRDFTVNSMMENVLTGEILDFWNGRQDLEDRIIRHVSSETFAEDEVRVLRAAQFSARFGFEIADETIELCRSINISDLPFQRVFAELEKTFHKAEKPSVFFEQLRKMEQLDYWFPELKALIGIEQDCNFHCEGDVWTHTMLVFDEAAKVRKRAKHPKKLMLSALCHNLGKGVVSYTDKNGVSYYCNYKADGLYAAKKLIERITHSKATAIYVENMINMYKKPNEIIENGITLKSINKMFDDVFNPNDLILLSLCDSRSRIPQGKDYEEILFEHLDTYYKIMAQPYVTKEDLVNAGLSSKRKVSKAYKYAHKLRLAGVEKSDALQRVLNYMSKPKECGNKSKKRRKKQKRDRKNKCDPVLY
ncbi:MAG: tRNA nucleotidyltransferase [Eubacterium sp.]|nr:tRNA nucleotidyltransferase [Eubacterium sp.]